MAQQYVSAPYVAITDGDTYIATDANEDTIYHVSPFLVGENAEVTIIDTEGNNTISLQYGLEIVSSQVISNEIVLTLSNGATIDIFGANNFSYDVGGDPSHGETGTVLDFDDFVTTVLGTTVPEEGVLDPAEGGEVVITPEDTTAPIVTAEAASYAENQTTAGVTLATVTANEAATFAISTGNESNFFAIDAATGAVSLTAAGIAAGAATNDYETGDNAFTLGIVATDTAGNASDATDLVLSLTNVQDETFTVTNNATGGSINEGGSVTFTVEASEAVAADTVFTYKTASSSAEAADFSGANAGSVTILAGETQATFSIAIASDNVVELAEDFTVTVKNSAGAVVGSAATIDINDVTVDLTAPVVTAAPASYAENSAAGTTVATVTSNEAGSVFAITTGNTNNYYAIDAATGVVTLTEAGAAAGVDTNDFEGISGAAAVNTFTLGVTATDAAGNVSTPANLVLSVTNVDDDAPTVTSSTVSSTRVVLEFNEALDTSSIPAGSAFTVTQTLNGAVTTKTLAATDPVTVNNSSVILTLATGIAAGSTITVSYTPPAISPLQDLAGNDAAAVVSKLSTVDATAPTLSSSTPVDNATTVAVADNLTLTFSESIVKGTGNIVITNASDATDTRTISVLDATQVVVSGSTATINPTADLKAGASYNVTMAAGVFTDAIGNAFAGIANVATLNFTVAGGSTSTGNTFTLTQGNDVIPGAIDNTGNDTINAFLEGAVPTFSSLDIVDGGTGIDTFTALGLTGTPSLAQVSNVEKFVLGSGAAAVTYDFGQTAGETSVTLQAVPATAALAATANAIQMGSTAFDIGVNADLASTSRSVFNFVGTTGGSDAVNLTLNTVIGSVNVDAAGNGIERVNIIGTGGNSTLAYNNTGGAATQTGLTLGAGVATLNISGSTTINLAGSNLAATVRTIDASAATGNVLVQQSGAATAQTFTGGSGNDMLVFGSAAANLTNADILNGGAGTADVFSTTTAILAGTSAGLTNFEVLSIDAAGPITQNMGLFAGHDMGVGLAYAAGADTVNVGTGNFTAINAVATFTGVANNANLYIGSGAPAGHTASVTLAADSGAGDVLNVMLSAAGQAGVLGVTLNPEARIETVNINSLGATGNTITAFGAGTSNVVLHGATAVTIAETANATSINASDMTAALVVTNNASTVTQTITGTSLGDTFGVGAGASVVGILAAGQVVTINGGDGNDTVLSFTDYQTATTGRAIFNGGAGNDTVLATTTSAGGTGALITLDGGDGIDTLTLTALGGTEGFETIVSTVTTVANADIITGWSNAGDSFDYNGALSNGTTVSGVGNVVLQASVGTTAADLSLALAGNPNSTVYQISADLAGASVASLATLAGSTAANLVANYTAFESDLISELATITNLDSSLGAADAVLMVFESAAHSVVVRVVNSDTTVANTLTTAEVELVGVFNGSIGATPTGLVAADFV